MSDRVPPKRELRTHVRAEQPREDDVVMIRGGPDTAAKLAGHATRMHAIYVLDTHPIFGISVFAALDDIGPASRDHLLAERMMSYRVVHLPLAGTLVEAGFELLPTFGRPISPCASNRLTRE